MAGTRLTYNISETVKFYFDFKDFKEDGREIIQQLRYEGYNCWVAFRMNNLVAVYTYIL